MNDETIFATALEKDPAERAAYLEGACQHDPEQRKRIEALLAAHDRATGFMERPAVSPPDPQEAATRAFRATRAEPGDGETRTHNGDADDDREDALGFLDPPGRPDSLGRLGRYEVLEVLGKGGFGIVFRVFDDMLQRVVAVKMLAPSMAATSPARKRFVREARASANPKLHHENVVQVHDIQEQPLPFLVMEFIPGETLQQRLDRTGPLEVSEVLRIGRQVAEGLAAAHATGLIHRDIKPSNILIDNGPQQHVKITDFGLARAADDASLTRSGVVAGTPMYMAPEQAKGETLDHRADLFSLGSVMYAMLTGRPPFRATTTLAVLKRVAEDDPRPIREVIPEVPEWLCRIVEKLHAKDPDDRYQSAREAADVLADCERQLAEHKELKDTSRIPNLPSPARSAVRLGWPAIAAAALLLPVSFAIMEQGTPGEPSGLISLAAAAVMGGLCSVLVVGLGQKIGWIGPEAGGRPRSAVRRWTWAAAVLVLALIPATVWFGRAAVLYADNAGELELLPEEGLVEVIVLQNDEGVRDENKLHPAVTDWLGMKERRRLSLPPGTYQLNAGAYPAGTRIAQWEVTTSGPFGSRRLLVPGEGHVGWSIIVKVERGKRTTVRPVMVTEPPQSSPKPIFAEQPLARWGEVINPAGDCRFTEENGRLTIAIPGDRFHDLNPGAGLNFDAPRVLKKVKGDFEAQLTVLPFSQPSSARSLTPLRRPYIGAGLTVWQDSNRFFRFVRAFMPGNRDAAPYVHFEQFEGGTRVSQKVVPIADESVQLRIRRTGAVLQFALRSEGEAWTELSPIAVSALSQTLQVGLLATSSLSEDFTARFEKFEIEELPPITADLPSTGIDLIPHAVLDPRYGTWTRDGNTLFSIPLPGSGTKIFPSAFAIPVPLPREFVLDAVFERLSGDETIAFNIPAGGTDFMIQLDGYSNQGYVSGLQEIDGKSMRENETRVSGSLLTTGRKHRLQATVRATGVSATLDGKPLFDYRGGYDKLSSVSRWAGEAKFYVVIITSAYRIHSLRLTPLKTEAAPEPEILKELRAFSGHEKPVWSVAISPDGRRALSGDTSGRIIHWDIASGKKSGELAGHTAAVESLAFTPDGKAALSGSKDLTLRFWDLASGDGTVLLPKLGQVPPQMAMFRDGKRALFGGLTAGVIDIERKFLRSIPPEPAGFNAIAVALSRDEKLALSGGMDRRITLWNVETGEEVRKFDAVDNTQIRALAFFPDGKRALSASMDGTAHVWDVEGGKPLLKFGWHTAGIMDAVIHPDGRHVITAGRDRTLRVWDSVTGEQLQSVELPSKGKSLALSPDGRTLLSTCGDVFTVSDASDPKVRVWRVTMPADTPSPALAPSPRAKNADR